MLCTSLLYFQKVSITGQAELCTYQTMTPLPSPLSPSNLESIFCLYEFICHFKKMNFGDYVD